MQISDSPVLWIRLDPEMILIRDLNIEQPDFQWQFQLRHERDVTAQFEAIKALEKYPTNATRSALTDTIENEQCFYKVRCEAADCLTKVSKPSRRYIDEDTDKSINFVLCLGCQSNGYTMEWSAGYVKYFS